MGGGGGGGGRVAGPALHVSAGAAACARAQLGGRAASKRDSPYSLLPLPPPARLSQDKFERMKAVVKRYVDGDLHALDAFPDGSQ